MIVKHLNKIFKKIDLRIDKISTQNITPDMEGEFLTAYAKCKSFSMTSPQRMYSAYKATEYIIKNNIPGDLVECGVWKGGSIMIMLEKLIQLKEMNRKIFLYDTFEGMSEPTEKDVEVTGKLARTFWQKKQKGNSNEWCFAGLKEVQENMKRTNYPFDNFVFIKGKVEDTIPKEIPNKISLLRLDTDWFESTYHEMKHLFPLLSKNGILIIDDYGHWKGSREAVDKYFEEHNIFPYLNRVDYSGRIYLKQ